MNFRPLNAEMLKVEGKDFAYVGSFFFDSGLCLFKVRT